MNHTHFNSNLDHTPTRSTPRNGAPPSTVGSPAQTVPAGNRIRLPPISGITLPPGHAPPAMALQPNPRQGTGGSGTTMFSAPPGLPHPPAYTGQRGYPLNPPAFHTPPHNAHGHPYHIAPPPHLGSQPAHRFEPHYTEHPAGAPPIPSAHHSHSVTPSSLSHPLAKAVESPPIDDLDEESLPPTVRRTTSVVPVKKKGGARRPEPRKPSATALGKRKASESSDEENEPKNKKVRGKNSRKRFSSDEQTALVDIVSSVLPLAGGGWETVTAQYTVWANGTGFPPRDVKQLRDKWDKLGRDVRSKPTGVGERDPLLIRVLEIEDAISAKAGVVTGDDDLSEVEVLSDPEDKVTRHTVKLTKSSALTPGATRRPRQTSGQEALTTLTSAFNPSSIQARDDARHEAKGVQQVLLLQASAQQQEIQDLRRRIDVLTERALEAEMALQLERRLATQQRSPTPYHAYRQHHRQHRQHRHSRYPHHRRDSSPIIISVSELEEEVNWSPSPTPPRHSSRRVPQPHRPATPPIPSSSAITTDHPMFQSQSSILGTQTPELPDDPGQYDSSNLCPKKDVK